MDQRNFSIICLLMPLSFFFFLVYIMQLIYFYALNVQVPFGATECLKVNYFWSFASFISRFLFNDSSYATRSTRRPRKWSRCWHVLNSTSIWPQIRTSNPTQRLAGACQLTLSITCRTRKESWPAEWQEGALPIRTLKRRTSNNLGSRHNLGRATHHHILIEHVASLLLSCVQIAIVNSVQLSIYKWGSITQALAVACVLERRLSPHSARLLALIVEQSETE